MSQETGSTTDQPIITQEPGLAQEMKGLKEKMSQEVTKSISSFKVKCKLKFLN